MKVTTHNNDGSIIECLVLCSEEGRYGVNIQKGVLHTLETIDENTVIFECKEGPFVALEKDGVLELTKK